MWSLGLALVSFTQVAGSAPQAAPRPLAPPAAVPVAKEKLEKDGYWQIEARNRAGDRRTMPIDKALYHAAILARAAGHKYVEMHDGVSTEQFGEERATLFARGSDAPVHPAKCRSGRAKRCYTADVAALIKELSGASGNEPGMPIPTYDKYGRAVYQSGFGIGAIAGR
jgi:hypothetical protein